MTTSRSDAHARERPGWAERPSRNSRGRYVECGGCGRSMTWAEFSRGHLRECDGDRTGADR